MSKNNKKTNKLNVKPQQDIDHGPATVAIVFPYGELPGSDKSKIGIRRLGIREPGVIDDKAVHGLMVVKSATENFSVREITVEPPTVFRKFVFRCVDVDGEEKTWSTRAASIKEAEEAFYKDQTHVAWLVADTREEAKLAYGPKITSVRAVQFNCPTCGIRVMDRDVLLKNSTELRDTVVEKENGKTFHKKTRVAKDDGETEVHSLRDLDGHKRFCPICGSEISDLRGKVWRLSDREVVPTQEWEEAIRKAMKAAPTVGSFKEAIPQVVGLPATLDHEPTEEDLVPWNDVPGQVGAVYVRVPEITTFVLDDAQKLNDLHFGNRDDRLGYGGSIGFVPRKLRPETAQNTHKRHGIITIGEAVSLKIGGIEV